MESIVSLFIFVVGLSTLVAGGTWDRKVTTDQLLPPVFECTNFRLQFGASGKVSSFLYKPTNRQLITSSSGNEGFSVYDTGGADVYLTIVNRTETGKLLAQSSSGQYQILFGVEEKDRHITFRIEQLTGFDESSNAKLRFRINPTLANAVSGGALPVKYGDGIGVGVMALDWMTWAEYTTPFRVEWRYLWHRFSSSEDPIGSIAIFTCSADQTLETVGLIEQAEGLPHPIYGGQWAKQNNAVARMGEMYVAFSGETQRSRAVDYCQRSGIGVFYIPQGVWESGSPYQVNTGNWPNGKDSLRDFSDLLKSQGILLGIHTGSCSLWNSDTVYVKPVPDPRLASWGSGRLAQAVSGTDTDLFFLPDTGTVLPTGTNEIHGLRPPVYNRIWGWEKVQIGNEIIRVGSYDTSSVPWHLSGCNRAQEGTVASSHDANTAAKGLLTVYGHLAVDPDSSLLQEIADKMSNLVNYCKVGRLSFDALETIESSGRWGMNKFMTKAYDGFDHFVATDSSSGLVQYEWHVAAFANNGEPMHFYPRAYFERYLIGSDNNNFVPEGLGAITFRVDSRANAWHASTPDEWQWWLAKIAAYDATYWFWSSVGELDGNGQTGEVLDLCRKWERAKLARVFTDSQRTQLKDYGTTFRLTVSDSTAPAWEVTPVKIIPRFAKADGGRVQVSNPYAAQPLRFEARVLPVYDDASTANEAITPSSLSDYAVDSGLTVGQSGTKWTLSSSSSSPLQANWYCPIKDLSHKRGVGLMINGYTLGGYFYIEYDSGGMCRHYIVPNDTYGWRYVEIPDFETADYVYHDTMYYDFQNPYGTIRQGFRYNAIGRISIGITDVPPGTTAVVAVQNVKALAEIEEPLSRLHLTANGGSLTVNGSVDSGNYIIYEGGNTAVIRDANRNLIEELPVSVDNWTVPAGVSDVAISTDSTVKPWVKLLCKTLGTPFAIPNPEDADLNDDGSVNLLDLNILAGNWLRDEAVVPGDMNWNNRVDMEDLAVMASAWLGQ